MLYIKQSLCVKLFFKFFELKRQKSVAVRFNFVRNKIDRASFRPEIQIAANDNLFAVFGLIFFSAVKTCTA